jgi:hypothetical protein
MAGTLAARYAVSLIAASWALAFQSGAAAEPDRRMEEFERRLSQLEGRLLDSEGDPVRTRDPSEELAALDRRLRLMEGRVRAHGNGVQIRGPLEVADARGNAILRVGDASAHYAGAAVSILGIGDLGGIVKLYRGDRPIISMGGSDQGIAATGSDEISHVTLNGSLGLIVSNRHGKVAQLSVSPRGTGELTLFGSDDEVAELTDERGLMLWQATKDGAAQIGPGRNGNTALRIYNPAGTLATVFGVDPGRDNTGTLVVYDSKGTTSAAVMSGERSVVVVADESGKTVAQIAVSAEERGIFQVFNTGVSIAALTKGASGGMLQLASDGGVPMVEAGVIESRRGTFRAGPMYKCTPPQAILKELPDCLAGRD